MTEPVKTAAEVAQQQKEVRTTFVSAKGQPVQVITPALTLTLPVVDLRELPETDREAETQRPAIEEAQRVFALAEGPLLRVKLMCLSEGENVNLLTMHRILSEEWSVGFSMQEMTALYKVNPPLPAGPRRCLNCPTSMPTGHIGRDTVYKTRRSSLNLATGSSSWGGPAGCSRQTAS